MTRRSLVTVVLAVGLLGLTLAAGPFAGQWETLFSLDPDGGMFVDGFQSIVRVDYTVSMFTGTSYSEFQEFGFLWQEFSGYGKVGGFDLQANILFGPLTADYLYAQLIGEMSLGGVEVGYYYAQMSDAVLGGPADGFAFRLAGSVGALDIVSITEFGARIADDDFDGIEIVHTASGFSRSYVTDPVVPGQGFTGQKVTISGLSLGCVEDIETTLYLTCAGFDFASFEISGIDTGISWLTFDLGVTFETQTKTITLKPTLIVGEALCLTPVFDIVPALATFSLDGIVLGGFDLTYIWNGVTLRDVTAFGPCGHYVITTPEYGSILEPLADAIENEHEYYDEYWELLSLEIDGDSCCGGRFRFLINSYFEQGSGEIFGWGMTYFESSFGIGSNTTVMMALTVDADGLEGFSLGFGFTW